MTDEAANHSSLNRIKKHLESRKYLLKYAPCVLEINCRGVFVHRNGPYQDEIEAFEGRDDWDADSVLTPKLKGSSYGDFNLYVRVIGMKYFDNRQKLDDLYSRKFENKLVPKNVERMSFQGALKLLGVNILCNTEYYLSHPMEMKADLGRKVENFDIGDKEIMKNLEAELLYSQAVKMFGEDIDDDIDQATGQKSLKFKDFRLLYEDGNFKIATASRGGFYVLFHYSTS